MVTVAPEETIASEEIAPVEPSQSRGGMPEPYRFSRAGYDQLIQAGILTENHRVELIEGEILKKMSIGPTHSSTVRALTRSLYARGGLLFSITVQDPVALSDTSEPEPDLALVKVRADDYRTAHPTPSDVYLVIEVADSSVRFDRERKIPLYAAAGIPEVWLVDLVEKSVTRHRSPIDGQYTEISRHGHEDVLPIPFFPEVAIPLAELGL
jgi:Uma2 family endonuclease